MMRVRNRAGVVDDDASPERLENFVRPAAEECGVESGDILRGHFGLLFVGHHPIQVAGGPCKIPVGRYPAKRHDASDRKSAVSNPEISFAAILACSSSGTTQSKSPEGPAKYPSAVTQLNVTMRQIGRVRCRIRRYPSRPFWPALRRAPPNPSRRRALQNTRRPLPS